MEQQNPNGPAAPQLDASIEELNKVIEETEKYESKARMASIILYVAILAVFAIFAWRFYGFVKTTFTKDAFVVSLENRAKELQKPLQDNLMNVFNKVQPVYTDEAQKMIKEAIPELKELSMIELQKLMDRTNQEVDKLIKEVIITKDSVVKSLFVNISPEDFDAEKIINAKAWTDEIGELAKMIVEPFKADWEKMQATINKFDNPNLSNDEATLMRQMAHYLLLIFDKEILKEGK